MACCCMFCCRKFSWHKNMRIEYSKRYYSCALLHFSSDEQYVLYYYIKYIPMHALKTKTPKYGLESRILTSHCSLLSSSFIYAYCSYHTTQTTILKLVSSFTRTFIIIYAYNEFWALSWAFALSFHLKPKVFAVS